MLRAANDACVDKDKQLADKDSVIADKDKQMARIVRQIAVIKELVKEMRDNNKEISDKVQLLDVNDKIRAWAKEIVDKDQQQLATELLRDITLVLVIP